MESKHREFVNSLNEFTKYNNSLLDSGVNSVLELGKTFIKTVEEAEHAKHVTNINVQYQTDLVPKLEKIRADAVDSGDYNDVVNKSGEELSKFVSKFGSVDGMSNKVAKEFASKMAPQIASNAITFAMDSAKKLPKMNFDNISSEAAKTAYTNPASALESIQMLDMFKGPLVNFYGEEGRAMQDLEHAKSYIAMASIASMSATDPDMAQELLESLKPDMSADSFIKASDNVKRQKETRQKAMEIGRDRHHNVMEVLNVATNKKPRDFIAGSKEGQQKLEDFYSSYKSGELKEISPGIASSNIVDVFAKIGGFPDSFVKGLKIGLREPQTMLKSAILLKQIMDSSVHSTEKIDSESYYITDVLSHALKSDIGIEKYGPKELQAFVDKNLRYKDNVKKDITDDDAKKHINDFMIVKKGFFGGLKLTNLTTTILEASPTLYHEYTKKLKDIAQYHLINSTSNTKKAFELAAKELEQSWGMTHFLGKEYFGKYPINMMLGDQKTTHPWAEEQFKQEYLKVEQLGGRKPSKDDFENITLQYSGTKNSLPRYLVVLKDKDGIKEVVYDKDGEFVEYEPDIQSYKKDKEIKEIHDLEARKKAMRQARGASAEKFEVIEARIKEYYKEHGLEAEEPEAIEARKQKYRAEYGN